MTDAATRVLLSRPAPAPDRPRSTLLIAGATGVLGAAVLQRLVGMQRHAHTHVLATTAMTDGLRGVSAHVLPPAPDRSGAGQADAGPNEADATLAQWPHLAADVAVVMFDPPRLFHGRERALWTPVPQQLPALARWLRGCGVHTLAVVQPHAPASLPQALQRGLASLDEQAVAAAGFERLLIVRSPLKPGAAAPGASAPQRVAAWMLSTLQYMLPSSEQPVRAARMAEFVDMALQSLPTGTWIAASDLVWRAAQGDLSQMRALLQTWMAPMQSAPSPEVPATPQRSPQARPRPR